MLQVCVIQDFFAVYIHSHAPLLRFCRGKCIPPSLSLFVFVLICSPTLPASWDQSHTLERLNSNQKASSAVGNYTTLSVHIAMNLGDVQFLRTSAASACVCVCVCPLCRYQSQVHEVLFMDIQEKPVGILGWHGHKTLVNDIRILSYIYVLSQLVKPYCCPLVYQL